jgi:hypothetical protein
VTAEKQADNILDTLDKTVRDVLAYFEGQGSKSKARVGDWGAWEVLCHFVFWHEATIEGMESVASGGSPYRLNAATDELNARTIAKYQGESFSDLTALLRELEEQLQQAARGLPDLDAPVIMRVDGTTLSGRERLEVINRHWANHVAELQAAEPS